MENTTPIVPPEQQPKWKKHAEGAWDLIKFAAIALAIVIPIRMFIAQPFVVSGDSMFPTFHDGEYLIVDEISYILGKPHRGDVVIFHYPKDPSRYFIKRIVGLPNEKIDIKNGVVTIFNKENEKGFVLNEPYIDEAFNFTDNYATADNEYFVMGDNRTHSSDSREFGFVPQTNVIGKVIFRYFPVQNMGAVKNPFQGRV